jgi:WW domain-binding protein 4
LPGPQLSLQSRRQHETGLKHQGQKERYIRELYKGGDRAKREKAAEAIEMARIEAVSRISDHSLFVVL